MPEPKDLSRVNAVLINNDATYLDWEPKVIEAAKRGDVEAMQRAAAPALELSIIQIGLDESAENRERLNAAQYVLEQAGYGPVKRLDVQHNYNQLPVNQLMAILKSRMEAARRLNPGLDFSKILPVGCLEGEFSEEEK